MTWESVVQNDFAEQQKAGTWEAVPAIDEINKQVIGYRIRWSIPDAEERYFWIAHYYSSEDDNPSLNWCQHAAKRHAARLNEEGKSPFEFSEYKPKMVPIEQVEGYVPMDAPENPQPPRTENMMPSPNKPSREDSPEWVLPPHPNMQFDTGAKRGTDATKTRYDLLPPAALQAWAEAFAEGAEKYGVHNWLKGIPSSNVINHALRHIFLYMSGDRAEDHLGHALWNIGVAIHNEKHRPSLVDMPPYQETNEKTDA